MRSLLYCIMLLLLVIGLPAAATGNKLVFLPVGYVINSAKKPVAVDDWNVADIKQMSAATGFIITPTMNRYSRQYISYQHNNYGEFIGRVITTLKAIKQTNSLELVDRFAQVGVSTKNQWG
ncbi:MAG: hypothetical protein ACI8WB_001139 [Phenylobacterium sp.]|jgi:hypothetical protein